MHRPFFYLGAVCLLVLTIVYNNNFMMFKVVNFIDEKTQGKLYLQESRNFVMGVVDDINPLKGSIWNYQYELPRVNLKLTKNELNYFDEVIYNARVASPYAYYMPNEVNLPINSKITINDEEFKVDLKLHGTNNPHFKGPKRSYSVKIKKKDGKKYPFGIRRFALVIPTQSNLIGLFTYKVAEMLDMLVPKNFLVRVFINGVDQGVYHLEEKLNKTLLERNGLSGYDVVRADDSWAHQYEDNHGTMFSFDYSGIQPKYISGKNLNQLVVFKKLLNTNDVGYIKEHINLEKFHTYDALRYIFGDSGHMTNNDNIKFIYNTSSGRLEPFFRIENHIEKIVSNSLTRSPEKHVNIGMFSTNNLLYNLTKDDQYRAERNSAIYKVLQLKDEILEVYDGLMEEQLGVLLNDTTNELPSRYFKYEMEQARNNLVYNFEFLKKYLDYSRIFIEVIKKNQNSHEVLIKPDSNSPITSKFFNITVDKAYIGRSLDVLNEQSGKTSTLIVLSDGNGNGFIDFNKVVGEFKYSLSLDNDLEPLKNIYRFILQFEGSVLAVNALFVNDLSGEDILSRDTYTVIVDEGVFLSPTIPSMFEIVDKKNLVVRSGHYLIESDLVLPYGMNLVIEHGVTIVMSGGVSVMVRGSLDIQGTESSNVNIIGDDHGGEFGSFSVIGDSKTYSKIDYLDISRGSEDIINGVYLSGAISLYNHSYVEIRNSKIHHNRADDGLNIKNAYVFIENNSFYSNKADQVDIDSGRGIIKGNYFSQKSLDDAVDQAESDSNGDGLDLSDSKLVISNNTVEGFLDKGLSIGEHTQAILFANTFSKNRSAVTAKDESKVYLVENQYINNEIDIEMYQKKLFFAHPSVFNVGTNGPVLKIQKTERSKYFKPIEMLDLLINDFDLTGFEAIERLVWVEYE